MVAANLLGCRHLFGIVWQPSRQRYRRATFGPAHMKAVAGLAGARRFIDSRRIPAMTFAAIFNIGNGNISAYFGFCYLVT